MQLPRRWFVRGLAVAPFARVFTASAAAPQVPPGGSLAGVPAALLPAFSAGPDDLPLPVPRPGDWLASHDEPGQTFNQFRRERQHKPTATRRKIAVKPLGKLAATAPLATIMDFAARFFGLPVTQRLTSTLAALNAKSRTHDGRPQYLTPSILDAMIPLVPDDVYCMIGVTMDDLYPGPSWNFVFGEARFHDRVGIYSFARYDPAFYGEPHEPGTDKQILRRCLKLMVHEIGHMFAIEHCIYYACVMNGSNNLEETDRSPLHPCPVCLRKLHDSIGFDVAERERQLAEFFRAHDLIPEAETAERRHARLLAAKP